MKWGYEETKRWKNTAGVEVSEGLTWLDGEAFKTISGGGGKGPLPFGEYNITSSYTIRPSHPNYAAYLREGVAFFALLTPLFKSDRTDIGVHPDGGVPGTKGCLGLIEKPLRAYRILSAIPKEGVLFEVQRRAA